MPKSSVWHLKEYKISKLGLLFLHNEIKSSTWELACDLMNRKIICIYLEDDFILWA